MSFRQTWAQPQRFAIFLFRIRHTAQHEIVFRHRLVRPGGIRIRSQQRIDGLFREQPAGPAEVIKKIRIVRMLGQRRLEICDRFRQLSGLDLSDAQRGFVRRPLQVWNRFFGVTLREQRITQQLMRRQQVGIQFQRMFQRRNRRPIIAALHIGLPQADEPIRKRRVEFSDFFELGDGDIELALLVRGNSGLHVLGSLRRCDLPGEV